MEPKIAIVIPVHNALSYTKKSLIELSCHLSTLKLNAQFKIIIVDDGSTDGTAEWIALNYPDSVLLHGDGNLWWSGGVNKGIEFALNDLHCEYVLLWENDLSIQSDYFSNLISIIEKTKNNIIIASKVYYVDKPSKIFYIGGKIDKKTGETSLIARDKIDSSEYEKEIEVDWTGGMGVLFNRVVFNKMGLFNTKDFPQYYGDCDFYLRAAEKGFSVVVYPQLKVWNDRLNTAVNTRESFKDAFHELFSIKSRYNLLIDIKFFTRHSKIPYGYLYLILKYLRFFTRILKYKFTTFPYSR